MFSCHLNDHRSSQVGSGSASNAGGDVYVYGGDGSAAGGNVFIRGGQASSSSGSVTIGATDATQVCVVVLCCAVLYNSCSC